jgi:hypothetical protein
VSSITRDQFSIPALLSARLSVKAQMPQYEPTPLFYPLRRQNRLCECLLLLRAQDPTQPDRWWTAGTGFLIADRIALTAAHIYHAFEKLGDSQRVRRQSALDLLGLQNQDPWIQEGEPSTMAYDAVQFLPDGRICRWMIDHARFGGNHGIRDFDSDLLLLFLKPHPQCGVAPNYRLSHPPRLQLVPPAIGQKIYLCGWPDNPHYRNGELPSPLIDGDFFFVSEASVDHLSTTDQTRERYDYPHFRSDAHSCSGMSGGPVLVYRPGEGYVICGSHISGDGSGTSRHSLLWPLLSLHIDHPTAGRWRVLDLVEQGAINAPCGKFFSLTRDGFFTKISCELPELWLNGTFMGRGDWIICLDPTSTMRGSTSSPYNAHSLISLAASFPAFPIKTSEPQP